MYYLYHSLSCPHNKVGNSFFRAECPEGGCKITLSEKTAAAEKEDGKNCDHRQREVVEMLISFVTLLYKVGEGNLKPGRSPTFFNS